MAKDIPDEGEAPIIFGMAEAAMHMYASAIAALPDDDDEFRPRVEVILTGLRKLRKTLTDAAARSRLTPRVIVALGEARQFYDDLMERARGRARVHAGPAALFGSPARQTLGAGDGQQSRTARGPAGRPGGR